jgi:hypothetical protein
MCQRVYVASSIKLPRVRRGERSPFLDARPDSDLSFFHLGAELPYLHLAGGHLVCGCGFPSETAGGEPDPRKLAKEDVASLSALVDYIRPACTKRRTALIYLCWAGTEEEPPESAREVSSAEMREPGFRLKHRQVLTVRSTGKAARRRTPR